MTVPDNCFVTFACLFRSLHAGGHRRLQLVLPVIWNFVNLPFHISTVYWNGSVFQSNSSARFINSSHFECFQQITKVNLNSMICPAVSDPFYGPYYRLAAILHQMLLVPLVSKGYRLVASYFLTRFSFTKVYRT